MRFALLIDQPATPLPAHEAEHLDAVIAVAARVPAARHGGAIEIRPCETHW